MKKKFEFAFFHVGPSLALPNMLVASIRLSNPGALISQITDSQTPVAAGVDRCIRRHAEISNLMYCRAEAYAQHPINADVCVFLDTDMLVVGAFDEKEFAGGHEIYLCRRFFNRDTPVATNFKNMEMHEYAGKTLDQAWPYLGCMLVCRSTTPLEYVRVYMHALPDKYKFWFGDQIALARLKEISPCSIGEISEFSYANINGAAYEKKLADDSETSRIRVLHFKGQRKRMMAPAFERLIENNAGFE